jgi:hypothetical protein
MQTANFYTVTDQNTIAGTISWDGKELKGTGVGETFIASVKRRGFTEPAKIFAFLSTNWSNGHYYTLPAG